MQEMFAVAYLLPLVIITLTDLTQNLAPGFKSTYTY